MNASLAAKDSGTFAIAVLRPVSGTRFIVSRLPTKSVLASDFSTIIGTVPFWDRFRSPPANVRLLGGRFAPVLALPHLRGIQSRSNIRYFQPQQKTHFCISHSEREFSAVQDDRQLFRLTVENLNQKAVPSMKPRDCVRSTEYREIISGCLSTTSLIGCRFGWKTTEREGIPEHAT